MKVFERYLNDLSLALDGSAYSMRPLVVGDPKQGLAHGYARARDDPEGSTRACGRVCEPPT